MTTEAFDVLIMGCGNGGMYLAYEMARAGRRVAVVEQRYIGGSCPNVNCLPSKTEIWSAKVAQLARRGKEFGLQTGPIAIDMNRVRQRKREMVEGMIAYTLEGYRQSGAELIMGVGHFVAPRTLEVKLNDGGIRTLAGERVFLNLGTHATLPDIPGLAQARPLTHIEMLELARVPEHLIVLGGGYVGMELAQAFRRFGSRVTLLEPGPQVLSHEDPEFAAELQKIFAGEGIDILLSVEVLKVQGRPGEGVRLLVRGPKGERTLDGSDLLVATGRTPNTAGIGLDVAGVELDTHGYIKVNDRLETTAQKVWAIGESAGSPQFTHVSFDDFRVIRDNLAGAIRTTRDRLIPFCLFTDPPLARIGLSEKEARQRGIPFRVVTRPMDAVLRTRTIAETRGFMKALIEERGEGILGFTMLGPEAGEVVAVVQMAMLGNLPYTTLRDAILAHPTMAEGLNGLFAQVK